MKAVTIQKYTYGTAKNPAQLDANVPTPHWPKMSIIFTKIVYSDYEQLRFLNISKENINEGAIPDSNLQPRQSMALMNPNEAHSFSWGCTPVCQKLKVHFLFTFQNVDRQLQHRIF